MDQYVVRNEKHEREAIFPTVTAAIREARKSGQTVYLHADDCKEDTQELGPRCPCRPVRL